MVGKTAFLLTLLALISFVLVSNVQNSIVAEAQSPAFYIDHEWTKVWINQNGTIDLFYDVEITCTAGQIHYVDIGQPNGDFTIGETKDEAGHNLTASDESSGTYYRARVSLYSTLDAGHSYRFTLLTNVGRMILEDRTNQGNVGMQFVPCYWSVSVSDLRVAIVLPANVTLENVRNTPDWNNATYDPLEQNRLVLYWERQNLQPDERLSLGVSFPKQFVQHYEPSGDGGGFLPGIGGWILPAAVGFIIIATVGVLAVTVFSKRSYLRPILSMETLGIRHGLTAVEASYLVKLSPPKIVTEILYSTLMKKAVWVTAANPSLKIQIMEPYKSDPRTAPVQLHYYELSFLNAIKRDGGLDEAALAKTIMLVRDTVEDKLQGYCRQDTIEYYEGVAKKAWQQVEQAGTPELASKAYNENLLWLLMDPQFAAQTRTTFANRIFVPMPDWWWYWYGYKHYYPNPTYSPSPTSTGPAPTIPGAEFANNVVTAIEKTGNNIVVNIEKFVNSILPAAPPSERTSSRPAHHGASCVCACAACACACACVSCACACASGGAG